MIYLENNMPAYIGYQLANTSDYIHNWKYELIDHVRMQQLSKVITHLTQNNLIDSFQQSLYPAEVVHLLNTPLAEGAGDNMKFLHLDVDDISKNINIIDNIKVNDFRVICIRNYYLPTKCHFSILKHNEMIFDKESEVITIFVDDYFLNSEKCDSAQVSYQLMKLIFTCVDYIVTSNSKIRYDVLSPDNVIFLEAAKDSDHISCELSPYSIFRTKLTTMDVIYIAEYFIAVLFSIYMWFGIKRDELMEILIEFPFVYTGDKTEDTIREIIDKVYDYLDTNKMESEVASSVFDLEYDIARLVRQIILNLIYE